ncbi:MAG: DUF58 domain-containing protein [Actinomyces bowdenii]|nr:DUF58 domain-containing protein [Actinomyces bowdenii]
MSQALAATPAPGSRAPLPGRLPRVGLTARGRGLVALAALLALAWYLLRLHLLTHAALLLLAPVATALLAVVVIVVANLLRRPRAELSLLGLPQVGQRVRVEIRTGCLLPRFLPAWVAWRVGQAPSAPALTPLERGTSLLMVGAARRGPAPLEALGIEVIEPLGLARARLPLGAGLTVLVLPQPLPLPETLAAPQASLRPGGRAGEQGEERVGSLRDYRPGDALASIHWKQSARLDRLVVTEPEHEARPRPRLALVVDLGAYQGPEQAETAVALAAGVIEAWEQERRSVDLLLLSRCGAPPAGRAGEASWTRLRYRCEEERVPALARVLALLEHGAPDPLDALRRAVAHHEPALSALGGPLPAALRADVLLTGASGPASPGPAAHPALDPRARGTLVLVGNGRAASSPEPAVTTPEPADAPTTPTARVPATWRTVEARGHSWGRHR